MLGYVYSPTLLREISRKHWKYTFSNEVVYSPKHEWSNRFKESLSPECYFSNRLWIELIILDRNDDLYCAIIESVLDETRDVRQADEHYHTLDYQPTMFISNIKLLEQPKSLKLRSIPSVIRLNYLGSLFSLIGEEPNFIIKRLFQPADWDRLENWELHALQCISTIQERKLTDQPIQGRPHIMDSIPSNDTQGGWGVNGKLCPEELASIIKFHILDQKAGFQLVKGCERSFKFLQVFFRPFEFQSWDIGGIHDEYLSYEKNRQRNRTY